MEQCYRVFSSNNHPNSIVVRDPEGNHWLVQTGFNTTPAKWAARVPYNGPVNKLERVGGDHLPEKMSNWNGDLYLLGLEVRQPEGYDYKEHRLVGLQEV